MDHASQIDATLGHSLLLTQSHAFCAKQGALLSTCTANTSIGNAQGAEEFRGAKRQRPEGDQKAGQVDGRKKQRGVAFGTGAAEETDTYGYMEDYVTHDGQSRGGDFNFEIASDEEDSDLPLARSATQLPCPTGLCMLSLNIVRSQTW